MTGLALSIETIFQNAIKGKHKRTHAEMERSQEQVPVLQTSPV